MKLELIKHIVKDKLTKVDILVMLFLEGLVGSNWNGRLSQRDIESEIGISDCSKSINKLKRLEYIMVENTYKNKPDRYKLNFLNLNKVRGEEPVIEKKKKKPFTTNDLCSIWKIKYFKEYDIAYSSITMKERGQLKRMLEEYGKKDIIQMISHTITKDRLINGYPSISAMYGFRRSIYPNAVKGVMNKNILDRQYHGDNWNPKDGF